MGGTKAGRCNPAGSLVMALLCMPAPARPSPAFPSLPHFGRDGRPAFSAPLPPPSAMQAGTGGRPAGPERAASNKVRTRSRAALAALAARPHIHRRRLSPSLSRDLTMLTVQNSCHVWWWWWSWRQEIKSRLTPSRVHCLEGSLAGLRGGKVRWLRGFSPARGWPRLADKGFQQGGWWWPGKGRAAECIKFFGSSPLDLELNANERKEGRDQSFQPRHTTPLQPRHRPSVSHAGMRDDLEEWRVHGIRARLKNLAKSSCSHQRRVPRGPVTPLQNAPSSADRLISVSWAVREWNVAKGRGSRGRGAAKGRQAGRLLLAPWRPGTGLGRSLSCPRRGPRGGSGRPPLRPAGPQETVR